MFRTLLKSKIHRARVTHCELNYEGSCAIDEDLLDAANIAENEQVHIWNINNGERFITYAIRAERGSRIISVNGSAARRAAVGDLVIIAAFAQVHEDQVKGFAPKLVFVNPTTVSRKSARPYRCKWLDGTRRPHASPPVLLFSSAAGSRPTMC
jgi:aspartate 1-decarboxylase